MAPNSPQSDVCSFPRCGRPRHAYGLCIGHIYQRNAGLKLRPIRRKKIKPGAICTFKGCRRPQSAKGLCSGHYAQKKAGKRLRRLKKKFSRVGGWQETPCISTKYPDLRIIHEVCFDWIIDFFLYNGVMPTVEEVMVAIGWQDIRETVDLIRLLARRGYLTYSGGAGQKRVIRAFGTKYKQPIMHVLYEKIYVGPLPRRLTAEQAMEIGSDLYYLGKTLHKRLK